MTKGVECRLSRLHSLGPRATYGSNAARGRWLQRTREGQQRVGTAGDGESESSLETARKSRLRVGPPTRGLEYVLRRLCQGASWAGEEREHRLRHHIAVPMTEATRPTSRDSACGAREPTRCSLEGPSVQSDRAIQRLRSVPTLWISLVKGEGSARRSIGSIFVRVSSLGGKGARSAARVRNHPFALGPQP